MAVSVDWSDGRIGFVCLLLLVGCLWFGWVVGLVRLLGTLVSGLAVCWFGLFFTQLKVRPV
jgi:hypothetical protein